MEVFEFTKQHWEYNSQSHGALDRQNLPISCTPKKHPLKNAKDATMNGVEPCGMRILKIPQHSIHVMITSCALKVAKRGVAGQKKIPVRLSPITLSTVDPERGRSSHRKPLWQRSRCFSPKNDPTKAPKSPEKAT